ncbi:hypothetical protein AB1484_02150 [Parafrankia sp. FMc6]|uniref:hypothetical protein n=1 Tax=Parafrankia soli TaxID=2599596 RepID=UPI0034D706C1
MWTETTATAAATGMEMAAVVIWTVDPAGTTISSGRYYSEAVRREGPGITGFIRGLGRPS